MEKIKEAFQDFYPDEYSHCFGCGRLNKHGLKIKSYWNGDESVCRIKPSEHYTGGMKHIVYGGLIASLMDCHGAATAAAAKAMAEGIAVTKGTMPRFVTASLKVDYIAPTPIDSFIELRGRVTEIKGRKVNVCISLLSEDLLCAKGELIMVQIKDNKSQKF